MKNKSKFLAGLATVVILSNYTLPVTVNADTSSIIASTDTSSQESIEDENTAVDASSNTSIQESTEDENTTVDSTTETIPSSEQINDASLTTDTLAPKTSKGSTENATINEGPTSTYPEFSASADGTTQLIGSATGVEAYTNSAQTVMRIEVDGSKMQGNDFQTIVNKNQVIPDSYKKESYLGTGTKTVLKDSFKKVIVNGTGLTDENYGTILLFIDVESIGGTLDYIPRGFMYEGLAIITDKYGPKRNLKEVNFPEATGVGYSAFMNIYSPLTKVNLDKVTVMGSANFVFDSRFSTAGLTNAPLNLPSLEVLTGPSGAVGFWSTGFTTINTPKLRIVPRLSTGLFQDKMNISGATSIENDALESSNNYLYNKIDTLFFVNDSKDITFSPNLFQFKNASGKDIHLSILTTSSDYTTFGDSSTTNLADSLATAMANKKLLFEGGNEYYITRYSVQKAPTTTVKNLPKTLSVLTRVNDSSNQPDKNHNLSVTWKVDGVEVTAQKDLESFDTDKYAPEGAHTLEGIFTLTSKDTGAVATISTGVINYEKPVAQLLWGTSPWTFDKSSGVLTIDPGTLTTVDESPWNRQDSAQINRNDIKQIVFTGAVKTPEDSTRLFAHLNELESMNGLDKLDTSSTTNMQFLFASDYKIKELDLSHFDTSNVTSMESMFNATQEMEKLDLSQLNTSKVENMKNMFSGNFAITEYNFSNFKTENVTNMDGMFDDNYVLEQLDLSSFNTKNVTEMETMFYQTRALKKLDLSHFDTSKVTNMGGMFFATYSLNELDISHFNTSNVENMTVMFAYSALSKLDLSHFDTSKVTNMNSMFYQMPSLSSLDISNFDTSKVELKKGMFDMFKDVSLSELRLGDSFKFNENAALSTPIAKTPSDKLTGNWIREDKKSIGYSPTDFMEKYGTGDLIAGTYVAEIVQPDSKLNIEVSDKTSKIGETGSAELKISHDATVSAANSVASDIVVELTSSKGNTVSDFWKINSQAELTVMDNSGAVVSTSKIPIDGKNKLELPDLDFSSGNEYDLSITGLSQNNTVTKEDIAATITYNTGTKSDAITAQELLKITSGEIKFESVPSELKFETTKLKISTESWLVNRDDPDWSLSVDDLRGSNANSTGTVDRKNWNVYATALPFKDGKGNQVERAILALGFIENGKTIELDETNEIEIYSHSISGEKPLDNRKTTINWNADSGFKAVVHKAQQLNTDTKYTASINFELRNEP